MKSTHHTWSSAIRLWAKRRLLFKLTSVLPLLSLAWACFALGPTLLSVLEEVWPRLHLTSKATSKLILKVPDLSPTQRKLISAPESIGVPIHQVSPRLKLIGVLEGVTSLETAEKIDRQSDPQRDSIYLTLGIFPQEREKVFRRDTEFSLRFQSPSLSLLVEDLLHSSRGERLQRRFEETAQELKAQALALTPTLKRILSKRLPNDLATRLLEDPIVLSHLRSAFHREIFSKIDWTRLIRQVTDSTQATAIQQLALKDMELSAVLKGAIKESIHYAWRSPTVFKDWAWLSPVASAKKLAQRGRVKYKESIKHAKTRAMTSIKDQAVDQLRREAPEVKRLTLALLTEQSRALQLKSKGASFLKHVIDNQALRDHLAHHYGPETYEIFKEVGAEFIEDEEVQRSLHSALGMLKKLSKLVLKSALLDHEGQGPNPLLLMVIQEYLRGERTPVIHATLGTSDDLVAERYVFDQPP
jgi:hypothetical protein